MVVERLNIIGWICFFVSIIYASSLPAQEVSENRITIELKAKILGPREVEVIEKDSILFLAVGETFRFLGIKSSYDSAENILEGFFVNKDTSYFIDMKSGTAQISRKKFVLNEKDYLIREQRPFLSLEFIKEFFLIDLIYNPRRLQIEVLNSRRLPSAQYLLRQRGIQRMVARASLPPPDSTIGRETGAFVGSRLDWYGTSQFSKSKYQNLRYNLKLGAKVISGDLSARLDGFEQKSYHRRSLHGNIRFPVFGSSYLRQIVLGDFIAQGINSREITGLEFTNRPFSIRRVFSREVYHGQLEPDMDIAVSGGVSGAQLQHTDERGTYTFETPLLYGDGLLEVRAFDPWGQEKILRYRESIPRTLIPPSEAEYSIAFGRIRYPSNIIKGNTYFNLGLTSELTAGIQVDYYDLKGRERKIYPGISATSRFLSNLIFYGSFVPGAVSRSSLTWRFPSSAEVIVNHLWYQRNSYFNAAEIHHDINGSISLPITLRNYRITLDLFGDRRLGSNFRSDELQAGLAWKFAFVQPRISHKAAWQKISGQGTYKLQELSNISFSIFLPAAVNFWSEGEYDHLRHEFTSISLNVAKRFPSSLGFAFSFIRIPYIKYSSVFVRLEYYFPFMRTQASSSATSIDRSNNYSHSLNASGSIGFDMLDRALYFKNRPNYSGYGGYNILPFFDMNGNNVYDDSDNVIKKGKLSYAILGTPSATKSLVADQLTEDRLYGYDNYLLYLDPQSLENPAWVPRYKCIQILTEPNYIRRVYIPVIIGGFVRGTVTVVDGTEFPAEGIQVLISSVQEDEKSTPIMKKGTTFSTGEFEIGPVSPGKYQVVLDSDQLNKLGYKAEPQSRIIQITAKPDGDIVEQIDFRLIKY